MQHEWQKSVGRILALTCAGRETWAEHMPGTREASRSGEHGVRWVASEEVSTGPGVRRQIAFEPGSGLAVPRGSRVSGTTEGVPV